MTFHEHAQPIRPLQELSLGTAGGRTHRGGHDARTAGPGACALDPDVPALESWRVAALYTLNGALSAVNISLSVVWHRQLSLSLPLPGRLSVADVAVELEEISTDATAFVAAHCMLLLATAVHYTPTLEPYAYLVKVMRALAALMLLTGLLRCANYLNHSGACHGAQCL